MFALTVMERRRQKSSSGLDKKLHHHHLPHDHQVPDPARDAADDSSQDSPVITCDSLAALCTTDTERLLMLDTRSSDHFDAGHISGAISVNLSALLLRRLVRKSHITLDDLVLAGVSHQTGIDHWRRPDVHVVIYDDAGIDPLQPFGSTKPQQVDSASNHRPLSTSSILSRAFCAEGLVLYRLGGSYSSSC